MTKNLALAVVPPATALPHTVTMHVNRGRLLAALRAVAPHACEDETRFHLMSVALELGGGKLNLITTNGHCLAHATIACEADFADHPIVLLSTGDAKAAIKLLTGPKRTLDRKVQVGITRKSITLQVDTTIATYQTIDAEYPPYRQVIPARASGGCAPQWFSPEYLAMLGASVDAFRSSNQTGMRMQLASDELAPIRVDYSHPSDGDFVGVMMPMRQG